MLSCVSRTCREGGDREFRWIHVGFLWQHEAAKPPNSFSPLTLCRFGSPSLLTHQMRNVWLRVVSVVRYVCCLPRNHYFPSLSHLPACCDALQMRSALRPAVSVVRCGCCLSWLLLVCCLMLHHCSQLSRHW
jgi:hypothetical protein